MNDPTNLIIIMSCQQRISIKNSSIFFFLQKFHLIFQSNSHPDWTSIFANLLCILIKTHLYMTECMKIKRDMMKTTKNKWEKFFSYQISSFKHVILFPSCHVTLILWKKREIRLEVPFGMKWRSSSCLLFSSPLTSTLS